MQLCIYTIADGSLPVCQAIEERINTERQSMLRFVPLAARLSPLQPFDLGWWVPNDFRTVRAASVAYSAGAG